MKNNGYTLVELIMVIAIIGLLTGMIFPFFLRGGIDEGVSTLQGSIFSAKSFAIKKRSRCKLTLNADYYTTPNPLPCTLTVEDMGGTLKKQYRLPKYIRFYQFNSESFTAGTKTVYFEPGGFSHYTPGINSPEDTVITLKDEKTGITTSRTIIGYTCQIKK